MKRILCVLLLLLICVFSWPANHFIRDGASGDGSDWTNAWDDLPATFVRGDIYYVADGAYGSHVFEDAVSGSMLITIKKAIASDHGTETGWNSAYGDGQAVFSGVTNASVFRFKTSYYVIDGQIGGGPGNWESGHGFKLGAGLPSFEYLVSITTAGVTNITISHVEMGNDAAPGPGCDCAVYATQSPVDITVSYCYIHYIGDISIFIINSTNCMFEYCRMKNVCESGTVPESCGGGNSHGAGIVLSGVTTNCTIRYNMISDAEGTGWIGIYDTSTGDADGVYVYGNVFFCSSGYGGTWGNGVLYNVSATLAVDNFKIYNNTFVDLSDPSIIGFSVDTSGNEFKNNIVYNTTGTPSYVGFTRDYNASDEAISGDSNLQTLTSDPFVNRAAENFRLTENTNAGTNLGSPYNVDMESVARTTWSRGAYEYAGGSPPDAPFASDLLMVLTQLLAIPIVKYLVGLWGCAVFYIVIRFSDRL